MKNVFKKLTLIAVIFAAQAHGIEQEIDPTDTLGNLGRGIALFMKADFANHLRWGAAETLLCRWHLKNGINWPLLVKGYPDDRPSVYDHSTFYARFKSWFKKRHYNKSYEDGIKKIRAWKDEQSAQFPELTALKKSAFDDWFNKWRTKPENSPEREILSDLVRPAKK